MFDKMPRQETDNRKFKLVQN